jgi:predicted RNase H-like HicB family nuclease
MPEPIGFIVVSLVASEEEGGYASVCPELGIASQGETAEEAIANLRDATLVFLNTIEQLGQRERVFKERHIRIHSQEPTGASVKLRQPSQIASYLVAPITGPRHKSALARA